MLDPALDPHLLGNVRFMEAGWYAGTAPVIVLTISDQTSALGSLLQWEDSLGTRLSPLFGTPAATARFVDRQIGDSDVRVLLDGTTERITYGIKGTRVIITTDTTTWQAVASLTSP
jgi:hypothetical protein